MKSYLSIINDFWHIVEQNSVCSTDIALFFYLLNAMNRNRWQMPVSCSTLQIAEALSLSRDTVIAARDRLAQLGLITVSPGRGGRAAAQYSLSELSGQPSSQLSTQSSKPAQPSGQLSSQSSGQPSIKTAVNPTVAGTPYIYDILDKDKEKENININSNTVFYILKKQLSEDAQWHKAVADYFAAAGKPISIEVIAEKLTEFQNYLAITGTQESADEMRKHFINWLPKNINVEHNNTEGNEENRRHTRLEQREKDILAQFNL